ncbi:MAG: HlyD family secretion protein [Azospirillaceae bacterium]|nr:HlyD family secretion protein [Azospirillaceae bacterium]
MTTQDPAIAAPTPSRKALVIGAGGLAGIALATTGAYWWTTGRFLESTDDAYVRADVIAISPRVAGLVTEVAVADNQRVAAGDVLARIEDRDYRAHLALADGTVAAAQADIAADEAAIASLAAQLQQQHSQIAAATAEVAARQADDHRAGLDYRRQQLLTQQQVTSAQLLETADADARRAQAAVAAARAAAQAAKDRLAVLDSETQRATATLAKAHAQLAEAEAQRDLARIDLDRTIIRAPAAGTVGQRTLRPGQGVEVGTPLMALVPADAYIVANYKETQLDQVAPGQPVTIIVDAFGGAVLTGHVDSFAPASGAQFALLPPDNATGNFTKIVQRMPVRIRVDPGQPRAGDLRPGLSVVTRIDTRPGAGAVQ